jgi:hypothetical protein
MSELMADIEGGRRALARQSIAVQARHHRRPRPMLSKRTWIAAMSYVDASQHDDVRCRLDCRSRAEVGDSGRRPSPKHADGGARSAPIAA